MLSDEQKIFIVRAFGRNSSPTKVRQEFLKHYAIKKGRTTTKYRLNIFIKVNQQFLRSGSIAPTPTKRGKTKRSDAGIEEVRNLVTENRVESLRKIAPHSSSSLTTIWKILRYDLKFKFYRITSVQPLTATHKQQRRQFCEWLLSQPEDFVQKIIWTDEKFFCLHQKPHRKNDGVWSESNPHKITETNNRNDVKVMIFVAIIDGKIPVVHPFVNEDGNLVSVNGLRYLSLLQDTIWPAFRSTATRHGLWWMQDGAPPHCTTAAKEFLLDKFHGRVISRGTDIIWPAHSPDLNPLDFHFWAVAQKEVYSQKPESIDSLIECVRGFAESYNEDTIRRVAGNVLKRARLCLRADGGHFQHLL